MPKKGVVIPIGATDDFDDVAAPYPSVIHINNQFYMYYTGYDGSFYITGLAISKDGINFVKKGVVLPRGSWPEFDSGGAYNACVVYFNNYFYLFYHGKKSGVERLGLALSKDGINFVKKGVVVDIGAVGNFDETNTGSPWVIVHNNMIYLYYEGITGTTFTIGLAISKDGINFVKKGVVIPAGAWGDFDNPRAYKPCVIYHDNYFFLYYSGKDATDYRTGLAISKDGINFVKKGVVIPEGSAGEFDYLGTFRPSAMVRNNIFYLYYSGLLGSNWRIGLALSKDGLDFT